jgi:tetratricopeptide (TPR) repeat protein
MRGKSRLTQRLRLLAAFVAITPSIALANPESARLRTRAYDLAYNLDYDEADREMQSAVRADPHDPAAERGLAAIAWLQIPFRRGAVTVDDYLGGLRRQQVALKQPPPELASQFREHVKRSLDLGEADLRARPNDAEALYQVGATVALQASYIGTVEGSVLGAFRAARRAFDLHERVLALDPQRADAGLVVGTYRYVVSIMSLPMRLAAYVAGFGGGKQRGLQLIEQAAARGRDAQADARFALVLLYNRESRYADALRVLGDLRREFPRNRILWLESGATSLRAGKAADAETFLSEGLTRLASDRRERMFGEEALWLYKRGAARVALDRLEAAEPDLQRALMLEAREWVTGRTHAELGKIADLRGDRAAARMHFQMALTLADRDNDPAGAAVARRWLETPYRR